MTAQILDGAKLSAEIFAELKLRIAALPGSANKPTLVILQVAGDSASAIYVRRKLDTARALGISAEHLFFPEDISAETLAYELRRLNQDDAVHGILLQLPLPAHLCSESLLNLIDPQKDVDGLTAANLGLVVQNQAALLPCTSKGIIRLLKAHDISLCGASVVILNASKLVGRPLALQLLSEGATVTVCHSKTKDLEAHVRRADIVVSATGKPHVIPTVWLTLGVVLVDVGVHRLADGSLCGDIEFAAASKVASWITPVPGGVGPMTVAMLMENVWLAYTARL